MNRIPGTQKKIVVGLIIMIFSIATATLIGYFFESIKIPETNIVIVYILAVLITARFSQGYLMGVLSSIIATLTYNYFFTAPYFSLSVYDPNYLITFVIMTITAIITGTLTSKTLQSEKEAKEKEVESNTLYHLTNYLTDAVDIKEIASVATSAISGFLACNVACLCFDFHGNPEETYIQQEDGSQQIIKATENIEEIRKRIENLHAIVDINEEFYDFPIYGRENILGLIRVPTSHAKKLTDYQVKLVHTMTENVALAMDRFYGIQEHLRLKEEASQERYRSNLLRAISHDLRTPLATIMGNSELLVSLSKKKDVIHDISNDINKEADWLYGLVENILSLTKLQDSKFQLKHEYEVVEEVLSVAIQNINRRYPKMEINVAMPNEAVLIPMDAKLIAQVLTNLLDNAAKHNKSHKPIDITIKKLETTSEIEFTIRDYGNGINEDDLPHLFTMFFIGSKQRVDAQHGIGIGLAICDEIIRAHHGTIQARNCTAGKGAEFIFTLPMKEKES
ncbi:DUF4118 domain-containing protein [Anaerorhabdus furcosa]|uniref:histidine kinase n=1 Tax=Anaerorhabdus furcosa TaxID=118967 RepID=A0A1T4Q9Q0_9FIRM|nr:DUF4118 domain-containing protein [Anaerorhabdus furcosa]SKA00482.1 two-component system, OmpR family, sensor histidine kinase KdpD [Anaerorhabdus furcosa]